MTPLHVWALVGGAIGMGLPVAIHLLTKPRGRRWPLPTFRFLIESAHRVGRRNRLRAFLVLTARTLAVALVALGFARLADRSKAADAAAGLNRKIIVLDCSLSMRASVQGVTLFDRARALAQKTLDAEGVTEADLVLAAHGAHSIFERTSANLTALREEIARARALPERLDATAAMDAAARSLAGVGEDDLASCEVVIISDLQRSNWAKVDFGRLPRQVPVRVLSVHEKPNLSNVAITKAGISGMPEAGARFFAVADVANYGDDTVSAQLELVFDGRSWTRKLKIEPGDIQHAAIELRGTAAGWRHGAFRLLNARSIGDVLREDDHHPLCVRIRSARNVALVTAERERDVGGPAYFLARGLEASPESTVKVTRYAPGRLEGEVETSLWRSDLLAVVNAGRLTDTQAAALGRMLSAGMPLLIVTQFNSDADNLKAIQTALGAALRLPVEFQPYHGAGLAKNTTLGRMLNRGRRKGDTGRFLITVDSDRRPFKLFGDAITRFTHGLSLDGGLASSKQNELGLEGHQVRASYNDGSAALVMTRVAAGRMAVLNMSVGGNGKHLGAHSLFVPLIQELSLELMDAGKGREAHAGFCGASVSVALPHWATRGAAERAGSGNGQNFTLFRGESEAIPTGTADGPRFMSDAGGTVLVWPSSGEPGAYLIKKQRQVLKGFTIVPPFRDESDLTVLDHKLLKQRLAKGRTLSVVGAKEQERLDQQAEEVFDWFFLAALGCLFFELFVLKLFRT